MTRCPDLGFSDFPTSKIRIAHISLAFDSGKMFKMLEKRGKFIKTEKWAKLTDMNQKISQELG